MKNLQYFDKLWTINPNNLGSDNFVGVKTWMSIKPGNRGSDNFAKQNLLDPTKHKQLLNKSTI